MIEGKRIKGKKENNGGKRRITEEKRTKWEKARKSEKKINKGKH